MAKKVNDAIQAAVEARMKGEEVSLEELEQELPEGVQAVPEYSVEDSKEKLLEIAERLGVKVSKNASKAQIVDALNAEIEAHTVDGEEADAILEKQRGTAESENEEADKDTGKSEDGQESGAEAAQDEEKLTGYVVTVHHGYTNLRRTAEKTGDNVAQLVESGKRLEVVARVKGKDGKPWFKLLSGLYIVDDPDVTKYGE